MPTCGAFRGNGGEPATPNSPTPNYAIIRGMRPIATNIADSKTRQFVEGKVEKMQ